MIYFSVVPCIMVKGTEGIDWDGDVLPIIQRIVGFLGQCLQASSSLIHLLYPIMPRGRIYLCEYVLFVPSCLGGEFTCVSMCYWVYGPGFQM
jgi:hypothetical protein